jgi:16S rRNA (guanine527-N7)-methyltransferase
LEAGLLLEKGLALLRDADPDARDSGPPEGPGLFALLTQYIEAIELFNPAYGLVGARSRRELVVKHILDSLAPLSPLRRLLEGGPRFPALPPGAFPAVADLGSGAGLPGIPLALALPEYPFTLIEKMGRRASFLRYALAVLGRPNVVVEEGPLEKARGSYRLITFRAFRPLNPALLTALFRLLEPEGALAAYKGRRAVIDGELRSLEALPCAWEIIPLTVPFLNEERHLVVIRPGNSLPPGGA